MSEDTGTQTHSRSTSNYLIPLAIVLGFALVAGAIFMSNGTGTAKEAATTETDQKAAEQKEPATDQVRAVTEEDHIKGNIDAPIKIVEYSDFECPFCQRFHDTMNRVMDEYDDSGEVAWVFRHFPIEQLHSKAPAVARASECAAEQGGNDTFWAFTDRYFEVSPSNNRTDIETVIPQIVNEIGLDQTAFQTCFESGKYNDHIEADIQNAVDSGGRGTPWSVVIGPDGETYPLNGAQPYDSVTRLIEIANSEQ